MLDDVAGGRGAEPGPGDPLTRRVARGSASTVLAAAMIAVGEVIEPQKTSVEIVRPADESDDGLGFDLDFGPLPDL